MEERSAGAVVFRVGEDGVRKFLLLLNAGHWDFPKGNMEEGETELQTVLREVGEETGLREIMVIPGFRRVIEYYYRRKGANIHKQVIYLLAKADEERVVISQEHQGFGWYLLDEARKRASYDNSRITLDEAEKFIVKGPA